MVQDSSGRIKPDSREGIIRLIIENNVKMLKWIDAKTSKEEDVKIKRKSFLQKMRQFLRKSSNQKEEFIS